MSVNLILRLLPFFIGLFGAYFIASQIVSFDRIYKFFIISVFTGCMAYFFTWYNIFMMKRTGEISATRVLDPNPWGYLLLLAGALIAGYGFAWNSTIVIIIAVGLLWFADDLLTRLRQISGNTSITDSAREFPADMDIPTRAFFRTIDEQRKTDPLIGAKVGGKEIYQRLIDAMKNEKGVHIDSVVCALGALGGYACQASLRAQALTQGLQETSFLMTVNTSNGDTFFFGDPLNKLLLESSYSLWSVVRGGVPQVQEQKLPDIHGIFEHVSRSIGNTDFGLPRFPEGHNAGDTPFNYVKVLWPSLLPTVKLFCPQPIEWPILFGVAIQQAMTAAAQVLPPEIALSIVMESAVPMSKVNLQTNS